MELDPILDYALHLNWLEASGLVFGVVCVWLLIKQNIWTWPLGIAYVLVSFVVFYQARLYADLALHVIFLVLNVYGWYHWLRGGPRHEDDLPVTTSSHRLLGLVAVGSAFGVALCGFLLSTYTDASLPYWDSATSVFSIAAMWMQAQKKIEHWIVWFLVDVLATGIYVYKEIYFYALLYLFYVGMAVAGLLAWRRDLPGREPVPAPAPSVREAPPWLLATEEVVEEAAQHGEHDDHDDPDGLVAGAAVAAGHFDDGDHIEDEDDEAATAVAPRRAKPVDQVRSSAAHQKDGHQA